MKNINATKRQIDILEIYHRFLSKFAKIDHLPNDYGIGESLFPSEIHTIEAIGKNQKINITELAKIMTITKGATSQMIIRLTKKGFVQKTRSGDNEKEVRLTLTTNGKKAYSGHEKHHKKFKNELWKCLENVTPEECRKFKKIMEKIETHIDSYIEKHT